MARVAHIIGQAEDAFGDLWDVREERPTPHGFAVLLGWPQGVPRGRGGRGVSTILTQELAAYLETYRHEPGAINLPVSRNAIKRLRAILGHHWRNDRREWWEERFTDLIELTLDEFAAKHGVSASSASIWRTKLVGPWLCKLEAQAAMEHVRKALEQPTCVAAERLGISAAQVWRLRETHARRAPAEEDEQVQEAQHEATSKLKSLRRREVVATKPRKKGPAPLKWSPSELLLLGTMPDKDVAAKTGRSTSTVAAKRKALGVQPYNKNLSVRYEWPDEIIAMLGKAPDAEIAKKIGARISTVQAKRVKLGIPAYYPRTSGKRGVWTDEIDARLGTVPDIEIAQDLGIHLGSVWARRKKLGIPACGHTGKPRRKRKSSPYSWAWPPDRVSLLGTMPDAQLASRLGISKQAVHQKRTSLGIPPFAPRKKAQG